MYYPDVHPDDPFVPSATLANDIRHLLNADSAPDGDPAEIPQDDGRITVTVYNAGTESLAADQAVQFPAAAPMPDEILPIRGFTTTELPWGIILAPLAPGEIGECVLNGPVNVTLDAGIGHYATPHGTAFRHSSEGVPILSEYTDGTVTRGTIAAGCQTMAGTGPVPPSEYDGPFAVALLPSVPQAASIRGGSVRRAQTEDTMAGGTVTLTGPSCGVYLAARYNTSTYAVDYAYCAANSIAGVPCPQGCTQYVHRLAKIEGGTVTQTQYGDITVAGVWL